MIAHILHVLKQVHPDTGITPRARSSISQLLEDVCGRVLGEAIHIMVLNDDDLLSAYHVEAATWRVMPPGISAVAVAYAHKVLSAATERASDHQSLAISSFTKTVYTHLKRVIGYTGRVGKLAPIFMAAVLDQLAAEVIELAGDDAHACKKNRIIHAHVHTAVHRDRDVHSTFSNAALSTIF